MANEFRIKNALQILKSHPVSNISNNVDIFENYDTSSLATVSSIKSYIDTIDFSSGSGEGTPPYTRDFTPPNWTNRGDGQYSLTVSPDIHLQPPSKYLVAYMFFDDIDDSSTHDSVTTTYNVDDDGTVTFWTTSLFEGHLIISSLYGSGSTSGGGGITWSTPVDANIVPDTDNKYDLGSPESKFSRIYLNSFTGGLYTYFYNENAPVLLTPGFGGLTIGLNAGLNSSGEYSTFVGGESGLDSSGNANTFTGAFSGGHVQGEQNVAVGYRAGNSAIGDRNVFLGKNAGANYTGNDTLIIANSQDSSGLIYGDFSTHNVEIKGAVEINGEAEINGDILPGGTPDNLRTSRHEIGSIVHQYAMTYTNGLFMQPDRHEFGNQVGMFLRDIDPENDVDGAGFIGAFYNDDDDIQGIQRVMLGTDGYGAAQVVAFPHGGVSFFHIKDDIENPKLSIVDDGIETHGITYIGDTDTDGSWRYRIVGDDLVYERREDGAWLIKQTISAVTPT